MHETRLGLKVPRSIASPEIDEFGVQEQLEVKKAIEEAGQHIKTAKVKPVDRVTKVRQESSDLLVVTSAKKLVAYIMTVTQKSPKVFRFTYVNRLQNYALDVIEYLFGANSLRLDNAKSASSRRDMQHNAYMRLKLLSYVAFLAYESGCILKKQYEIIAQGICDTCNLLVSWTKSDQKKKES